MEVTKVLTPAEVAEIRRNGASENQNEAFCDSHEALRKFDQDWRDYIKTIRLNIPAEFKKQPQLDLCMQRMKEEIARLRRLIEGIGHEHFCTSRACGQNLRSTELGQTHNLGLNCNCILSKVNL